MNLWVTMIRPRPGVLALLLALFTIPAAAALPLLSPEGLPVAGAVVSLMAEGQEYPLQGPSTSSDGRGVFTLPMVPAGTYKLTAQVAGVPPAESRVVVTPGGTVHVDVVMGAN